MKLNVPKNITIKFLKENLEQILLKDVRSAEFAESLKDELTDDQLSLVVSSYNGLLNKELWINGWNEISCILVMKDDTSVLDIVDFDPNVIETSDIIDVSEDLNHYILASILLTVQGTIDLIDYNSSNIVDDIFDKVDDLSIFTDKETITDLLSV